MEIDEGITITRRNFVIDQYKDAPLDGRLFDLINNDMDAVRQARFTAVIRFTYTNVRLRLKCELVSLILHV